jgi:DNA (cytosine-5)-methyltransferase 1
MTVGSLFAGIGGFDLGFERAGYDIRWQVEIDPWARAVLAKHWPHVYRHDDIRTAGAHNLEAVDVLCGGFPCQDISLAGKGAGMGEGTRSGLWSEYARLIRELRPRYVVVENVAALLARGLGRVVGDLAACGYDAEWDCIPAAAVGAPHRRDRLWLVAYPQRAERWQVGGACDGLARRDGVPQRQEGTGRIGGSREDVADATGCRVEGERVPAEGRSTLADVNRCRTYVADADGHDQHGRRGAVQVGRIWSTGEAPNYGHAGGTQWRVEPNVGRVAHGIPARVDRLRGLGNAIVPQIAEWIAHRVNAAEARRVAA